MKTNFALVVMTPTDDPEMGSVRHLCFYETYPSQADVNALVEELRTDEAFGMLDMVCDVDYGIIDMTGDNLKELRENLEIPEEFDDLPEDFPLNTRVDPS